MPSVDIAIHYRPANLPLHINRLTRETGLLMSLCGFADRSVSIVLVDDEEMSQLNKQFRHKDGPTNVLSFPIADGADASFSQIAIAELGDIIISLDTAQREALQLGHSCHDRLTWLITHGLLHLLGYDHERSEREAEEMYARELSLLTRLHHHRRNMMTRLAINVDHVATVRQARGITEPDPVTAAAICELAGAVGIVVHLREDRRHIQDRDVYLLRQTIKTRLNLEMGADKAIVKIALDVKPDMVTLVPEKRLELTTEGGLNVVAEQKKLAKVIEVMTKNAIPVSLFVDPDAAQIEASHAIGATYVEIHTGKYCDAKTEHDREAELQLIATAADQAFALGLRVNAGHGLDYRNTAPIAALDTIEELSIGHAIISRAVYVGLDQAVREMLAIIRQANTFM